MKKSTVGFFIIIVIGIVAIFAWKYLNSLLFEKSQLMTSDAGGAVHTLRFAGDNYLGYWFITSPEMRKMAARKGLQIEFHDDGGAYAKRLELFEKGEYDCIVLPVNSYLEHGRRYKYPGVIIAAISESKGADGIVGFSDRFPSGKINELNNSNLKIVYTANSPSSFLLDLTIADFDLSALQTSNQWQVQVESSEAVLKQAKKGNGDVFILWEPDLSKALKIPGIKYVWGSDRFSGYIVDVFVFRRTYLKNHPNQIKDFLNAYFRVLTLYSNNQNKLINQICKSTGLKSQVVMEMMDKIDWFDFSENCFYQFGIRSDPGMHSEEGIINTIIACTDVMVRTGRLDTDPLQGNPYRITNSTLLKDLSRTMIRSVSSATRVQPEFTDLTDAEWKELREIGTFRIEAITFQSWNNMLTPEGKEKVDRIANLLLNNYPHYRIVIRGHTAPGGDETENQKLSLARANAVSQYLIAVHRIRSSRIRPEGVGSRIPAKRIPGESYRSYQYRLSRVEFIALEENRL